MSYCPISNFIGNRCMPDPVRAESISEKNQNFAEEASFFTALFKNLTVRPVPDPGLIMVLNKQWLERKKEKCPRKANLNNCGWARDRRMSHPGSGENSRKSDHNMLRLIPGIPFSHFTVSAMQPDSAWWKVAISMICAKPYSRFDLSNKSAR